jgi:hypothetical protein
MVNTQADALVTVVASPHRMPEISTGHHIKVLFDYVYQ